MNNVIVPFVVKHFHDFWRPFKKILKKPTERKAFALIKGIIQGSSVQLSTIGRVIDPTILPKTWCEKVSQCLTSISALSTVLLLISRRKKFRYFILDESDIQRPYARKLKDIKQVRDGSTGNLYGQGYPLIAVVGITTEGEYIPLILRRYDNINPARRECIDTIIKFFGERIMEQYG